MKKSVMQIVCHVIHVQKMDSLIVSLLILVMNVIVLILLSVLFLVFQGLSMHEKMNYMYHGIHRKLLIH